MSVAAPKPDGRREAGARTRQRLLDAALGLLAQRGQEALTLREITEAAQANVAAVSYHFGSKDALCQAAMRQAIETIVAAQVEQLAQLGEQATLADVATAWVRPLVIAASGSDLQAEALMRIAARGGAELSDGLRACVGSVIDSGDAVVLAALRRALPQLSEEELCFRERCAKGVIAGVAVGAPGRDLRGRSAQEIERLLVPVLTGVLAGGPGSCSAG